MFVQPATVIAWRPKRFRDHWTRLSRAGTPGRPPTSNEIRERIRKVSDANPLGGTSRIVGELAKLGIKVAKSTVAKIPCPISQDALAVMEGVPERFKLLFVLVVFAHSRRKVLHFNVTENPTARRTAQQIAEAFPWTSAPKYLLRDRDAIYGGEFQSHTIGLVSIAQMVFNFDLFDRVSYDPLHDFMPVIPVSWS